MKLVNATAENLNQLPLLSVSLATVTCSFMMPFGQIRLILRPNIQLIYRLCLCATLITFAEKLIREIM